MSVSRLMIGWLMVVGMNIELPARDILPTITAEVGVKLIAEIQRSQCLLKNSLIHPQVS